MVWRNQNQLHLCLNSLTGHGWFPVAPFIKDPICAIRLCLPCPGETVLGEDHPDTLTTSHNLAMAFKAQGHLAEAERLLRQTLEKSPGAQLQRFQGGCGQWIWGHALKCLKDHFGFSLVD